jgi:hypothetical protein
MPRKVYVCNSFHLQKSTSQVAGELHAQTRVDLYIKHPLCMSD